MKSAERKRYRRKMFWVSVSTAIIIVSFAFLSATYFPPDTWRYYFKLPTVEQRGEGQLVIRFLNVGQGDATIIEFPDGKTMLIDGGDGAEDHTTYLIRYAKALKIHTFDYVLLTHIDGEHIGGIARTLDLIPAKKLFYPAGESANTNFALGEILAKAKRDETETVCSEIGLKIESDNADYPYTLLFLSPTVCDNPEYYSYSADEKSAVLWLEYAGKTALFMADATTELENLLVLESIVGTIEYGKFETLHADILKVSRHGSSAGSDIGFLEYIQPKTAVISVGADNPYGYPSVNTTSALCEVGADIFQTDVHGTISVRIEPNGTYTTETEYTPSIEIP